MARPAGSAESVLDARERDIGTLARNHWDVLVVGGGITGCGVLLDAASRGLSAALIEREDFAVGTSSRSSRLIHGGLRYLEQFQIGLVREALRERSILLKLAPHLVRLEAFLFPVYGGPLARPFYGAGLTMYDLLGAAADGGFHRHLSVAESLAAVPSLRRKSLRGAFLYHDGQEDDARYVVGVVRTARSKGALALTRVTALRPIEEGGRLAGCVARDELGGSEFEVHASSVIDATGVWTGRADGPFPAPGSRITRPSRGVHLVVPRDRIPSRHGLTLRIPHRVCFLVPWPDRWVIGTTDHEDAAPVDRPSPTLAEVDEILGNVNGSLDVGLTRQDVVGAFAGFRPLATDPGGTGGSTVKASREHRIRTEPNGLIRISGGKFTTYRLMAQQTVDAALGSAAAKARPSTTAEVPIVGAAAQGALDELGASISAETGLARDQADRLVARHGTEATDVVRLGRDLGLLRPLGADGMAADGMPLEAEVVWSVRQESALSVDDFLARRTRLAQELADRGAAVAPRVSALMGAELGWSSAEQRDAVTAFLANAHREYDVPLGA